MADEPQSPVRQPHLVSYIVSPPVKKAIEEQSAPARIPVIISPVETADHPELGLAPAKARIREVLQGVGYDARLRESDFYLFAELMPADIQRLAEMRDSVYQIWSDETCYAHLLSSTETVKATACWRTFDARGKGITWAVLDTGIRCDHPHFTQYQTIDRQLSRNFSSSPVEEDRNGHGTHVAGIIAGAAACASKFHAATYLENQTVPQITDLDASPSGVAPLAKLVNVKVLGDDGAGSASAAILGLEYVRKINENSREIRIDGVNLSLGYPFDPKWYGCGHSPLCQEVERAVDSGLVVVVSCGNSGYGSARLDTGQQVPVYIELSINDPANAAAAIAVGSVHKSAPHTYGISYFSSKGPTGDGRLKPDLVAPGEKVISCSLHFDDASPDKRYEYEEKSGTSMAAPHVSGAVAAFLSVHKEFRGDPERIKEIFLKTATDLMRQRNFQGAGLVDLLRATMAV